MTASTAIAPAHETRSQGSTPNKNRDAMLLPLKHRRSPLRSRHRGSVLDRRLLAELSRRASLHIQRCMQQVEFVRCIEDWQATGFYRARMTLSEFGLTSETDR